MSNATPKSFESSLEELERLCALIPDDSSVNVEAWCWKGKAIGIIKYRRGYMRKPDKPS